MKSYRIDPEKKILTLGPEGTFSDQAAKYYSKSNNQIVYTKTFTEALLEVSLKRNNFAVVPIENSVAGTVTQIQDSLVINDLVILSEINLKVAYSFLVSKKKQLVNTFFSHPLALEQSSNFVSENLSKVSPQFTKSNIESGLKFLELIEKSSDVIAAIVPFSFAIKHEKYIQAENIQDFKNNTTRFIVVKKKSKSQKFDFSNMKTAIYVENHDDRPGILYQLLSVFNLFGINLCKLESRPLKSTPWIYVFYVDFYNTPNTKNFLKVLDTSKFKYKVLGSYNSTNLK